MVLEFLKDIPKVADTIARNLPVTGQQLLLIIGGFFVLLLILTLLALLQRVRNNKKAKVAGNAEDNGALLMHQLEELALDAEALEELYQKRLISADLFLEEATALKRHADLLQQYLLRQK